MGPHEPTPTPNPEDITFTLPAYPPEIVAAAVEAWHQLAEIVEEAVAIISRALCSTDLQTLVDVLLVERLAIKWAETAHPEWVKILNRTKKRRTRKKYTDRILKAYKEETA